MAEKGVRISFRAPATLRDLVKEYITLGAHMNESEFYRDAAREKIQKDAPELYRKLFKKPMKRRLAAEVNLLGKKKGCKVHRGPRGEA